MRPLKLSTITRAGGLIAAIGAQKASYFVLQLAFGRVGGLPFVGALAAFNAVLAVTSSSLHAGLPDWAMYAMATPQVDRPAVGKAHGLFLALALGGYLVLGLASPWLIDVPALRTPMLLVLAGSFGSFLVSFTFSGLRGAGRPGLEIVTVLLASAVTLAVSLRATEVLTVTWGLLAVGGLNLAAFFFALRAVPSLSPSLPGVKGLWPQLRKSLPYLIIGTGSLWLGNADILLVRWHSGSAEVGLLQSATLILRAGLFGPWFAGSLLLKPVEEYRRVHQRTPLAALLGVAAVLAVGALLTSRLVTPWAAGLLQAEASAVMPVLLRSLSIWWAPYAALLLLPLATAVSPARVLQGMVGALAVTFGPGVIFPGLASAQLAQAAGYLVLAVVAAVVLHRARHDGHADPSG